MQKQRKYNRRKTGTWQNANSRLNAAAIHSIVTLGDKLQKLDPLSEESRFALDYLSKEYLSKYNDDSVCSSSDRRDAAIAKWRLQEEKNRSTNESIVARCPDYHILPYVSWQRFLKVARRIIRNVLGPLRSEIVLGSFSGGASTSRKRTESSRANKFVGKADITQQAGYILDILYRLCPLFGQYETFAYTNVVTGSVLFTVPKKSDIDRCACKEPDINMFLQKGVGSHIRRRLKQFGINLNDQSYNRALSQKGSETGSLCTIDLSSASDSITIECVRSLLPNMWFEYLNDIRSHYVMVDGESVRMEMFSSMGNGFTFELESLIFYALTRATAICLNIPSIVSVYGDDVICSSELFTSLSFVFQQFGFVVNEDKSFYQGPFRESCGGHYLRGIDVTPFYLRRKPVYLTDLIRVCNQLRRWSTADPFRQYEIDIFPLWEELASYVPRSLWGGYDLDLDTQLASPGRPASKLLRLQRPVRLSAVGSYLDWHNSNWNRQIVPIKDTITPVSTEPKCRMRKAPRTKCGERLELNFTNLYHKEIFHD